ncbi:hypothetical protein CBR_g38784 [Chara braunii]|uniref:Uncharacterized protein n=1 Tax=Chara braunii TaxID=69332 RepID=A0A388LQN2_CHABU|nr:hypothetical protein CBR_g38784 [Chara braunii]|eukprot:GBG84502.1 hypothetical protein CBR_g38784 [Chara braunii]
MCRSAGDQGGAHRAGQSPARSSRPSEWSGYAHLPPHLQPLPDTSNEEEEDRRSRTVPLGSGSTQEWAATKLCGSRDGGYGQSYTELLQQGLSGDEGDGGLNLSFGLCSGRSSAALRTMIVNSHPDDEGGQVTAVARSSKSPAPIQEASGNNGDPPRQQFWTPSVSRPASARSLWMQSPSPLSASSTAARRGRESGETNCGIDGVGDARDGREVWAEWALHPRWEESITRGVQRLRVGERENDGDAPAAGADDQELNDDDDEGGEDDAGHVTPLT